MTQIWVNQEKAVAVTAIELAPCCVLQKKTVEKDGYSAIQIGFEEVSEKKLTLAERGHHSKAFTIAKKMYRHLCEVRDSDQNVEIGDFLDVSLFKEGEKVVVSSVSKGKGFQGVVKRYNFRGGPKTHGSKFHRSTGSVGAGTDPGRIFKGKKMPGRMGGEKTTIRGLEIIRVDVAKSIMFVKGSIPGVKNSVVRIYASSI